MSHTFETSFSDLRAPVDVLGWFPHMHTLGDTIRMEKIAGDPDDDACMGDVPRWDFHWQELAFYEEPLTLTPQDAVALTCTWDTSDRTETTTFGEGTQDEMCVAFLYVVEH